MLVMMVPVFYVMNFDVIASFNGCFHVKEKYFIKFTAYLSPRYFSLYLRTT